MNYVKCPFCGNKLVKRNGPYGTFVGCSNYPTCNYSDNLSNFNEEELKLINYPILTRYKGECNRCGQIRTLNIMGLCPSCEEWYEEQ